MILIKTYQMYPSSKKLYKNTITLLAAFFVTICAVQAQDADCNVSDTERQALIDFYNATNGDNWRNTLLGENPWLINDPNSSVCDWYGVSVQDGSVSRIQLNDSGLSGIIPDAIGSLSQLQTLELSSNRLSGKIPAGLANLAASGTLDVLTIDNNSFIFRDFNSEYATYAAELTTFTYTPQSKVYPDRNRYVVLGETFTLAPKTLTSTDNSYQWKSSSTIPGATNRELVISNATFDDISWYDCTVTNSKIPNLTINSERIRVRMFETTCNIPDTEDQALLDFYESTNGSSWTDNTNWSTDTTVCEWFGIGVGRFSNLPSGEGDLLSIELENNGLSGTLPEIFDALDNLGTLVLRNNNISGKLPSNWGSSSNISFIDLSNNNFSGAIPATFFSIYNYIDRIDLTDNQLSGKIEFPNLDDLDEGDQLVEDLYLYHNDFVFSDFEENYAQLQRIVQNPIISPQAKVDQAETLSVAEKDKIILTSKALTSPNNSYQWYKDGTAIAGAIKKDLVISNAKTSDAGVYHFTATNSIVTDLTLERNPITLVISKSSEPVNPAFLTDCETCYSFKPEPGRYVVDAWTKETGSFSRFRSEPLNTQQTYQKSAIDILITDSSNEVTTTQFVPSGNIIEGWQRVVGVFEIPNDAIYFEIELKNILKTNQDIIENVFVALDSPSNSDLFTGYEIAYLDRSFDCTTGNPIFINLPYNEDINLGGIYRIVGKGVFNYFKVLNKLPAGETYPDLTNSTLTVARKSTFTCLEISNLILENQKSQFSFFDDVRIYPYDANMKSFVYDYDTQRLVSELDENNFATFYEYDQEGGLIRVKKETERGIYTIQETRSHSPKRILKDGQYEIIYEEPNDGGENEDESEGEG